MSEDPGYVDAKYLEAVSEAVAQVKHRSYEFMHIGPAQRLLDVGCGPGTDTIPMAESVGAKGQVIGLDNDEEMIAIAKVKAEESGVSAWVTHDLGDAGILTYESDFFDACRSERVFQHLENSSEVLAEMIRVTKSGGWIVVADTDHSTMTIDTAQVDIEWRVRRLHADRYANGYAGRQLYRMIKQQHLMNILVEVFPIYVTDYALGRYFAQLDDDEKTALAEGVVSHEELQLWHAELEHLDKEGTFFACINMVMVGGQKP
ncbi:MAG: methyltransferase domain-containing protein [Anaerolineales bacterium]